MGKLALKVGLEVTDEGLEIPMRDRRRVFGRFVKLEDGRNSKAGTGVGLSVAKGIVDAHGGIINIRANGLKGSTVSFEIPRHAISQDHEKAD